MLRIRSFKPEDAGAIAAQELLRWAATQRVARIYLGTTAKFLAAHRFYEKNGFTEIDAAALPGSFPIMTVDTKFYCLALQPGAPSSPVDRSMP